MGLIISSKMQAKLAAKIPPVTTEEILQCFANRSGRYLIDDREEHKSDPPTRWFIAQTDLGRVLKIVFILRDGNIYIRTAYDPDSPTIRFYDDRN